MQYKVTAILLCISLIHCSPDISAHEQNSNTLNYDQKLGSPTATINDVSWISGYWKGQAWGGETEEIWSQPTNGSMMASFKFAQDGQVKFYELIIIKEQDNSLVLKLKHFGNDLVGWEEKEQTVDFKLVKIDKNIAYFDGYTYEKVSDNEMNAYVVIDKDGKAEETKFSFKRMK